MCVDLTDLEGIAIIKSTGIVRKVDELGRIVLPIELRRTMSIEEKDSLEIYVDGANIILHKYQPSCVFCGGTDGLVEYESKNICRECKEKISQI